MTTKPVRVAIYLRVTKDDNSQDTGLSYNTVKKYLRRLGAEG